MISRKDNNRRYEALRGKLNSNKKITLSEELDKMKRLSGLISESETESDVTQDRLYAGTGMILKLDSSKKTEVSNIEIPEEPHGVELTKLPEDKLHITLTGMKNMSNVQSEANLEGINIPIFIQNIRYYIDSPGVELGESRFVYRDENGERKYSPDGKVTYVVVIKNQDDIRNYVNAIYNELEIENPEPNRFYHITLANNRGGDSFESIGDVDQADFQ